MQVLLGDDDVVAVLAQRPEEGDVVLDLVDLHRRDVLGHDLGDPGAVLCPVIHDQNAQRGPPLAPGPWCHWKVTHVSTGVSASTSF